MGEEVRIVATVEVARGDTVCHTDTSIVHSAMSVLPHHVATK